MRALAAAQAGIDHYLGHLNQDRNYFVDVDCDNPALAGPNPDPDGPQQLRVELIDTRWLGHGPARTTPKSAVFHYDVDSHRHGPVHDLAVLDRARREASRRTLQAKISIAGSQRYLYVTDFEDADPENTVMLRTTGTARRLRRERGHLGQVLVAADRQRTTSGALRDCREIRSCGGDILDGPVHFNDMPADQRARQFRAGLHHLPAGMPEDGRDQRLRGQGQVLPRDGQPLTEHQRAPAGPTSMRARHHGRPRQQARLPVHRRYPDPVQVRRHDGCLEHDVRRQRIGPSWGTRPWITSAPNCGICCLTTSQPPVRSTRRRKQNVPVPDGMVIFVQERRQLAPRASRARSSTAAASGSAART